MNVLMFGWEFPPNISGGLGTACQGIVNGLATFPDIKVIFVVPKTSGNEKCCDNMELLSAEEVANRKRIRTIKFPEHYAYIEVASGLSPYLTPEIYASRIGQPEQTIEITEGKNKVSFSGKYGPSLFDEIANYAKVAKTIASDASFEIIHAHDWLTFPAAIEAKRVSGKPLVVHIHSTDFDRSGGSANPAIYEIEKNGMDQADQIITVSDLIKRRLTDQYHIPASKITTIYNAVANHPEPEEKKQIRVKRRRTVTFLGRLTIQKGPEYFVNVARMIIHKIPDVHFVMAGAGEMKDQMVELCARFGLGDRFHFTGFLNGQEVDEVLRSSDVVIMPSVSEPFGIVPLEAMSANVPVIISRQSGVAEMVKNAIITDFWDVQAMADAVHGILKHKLLAKTLSDEGRNEVQEYNWEKTAGSIRKLYRKTIRKIAS